MDSMLKVDRGTGSIDAGYEVQSRIESTVWEDEQESRVEARWKAIDVCGSQVAVAMVKGPTGGRMAMQRATTAWMDVDWVLRA